ncbi:MAG TPA: DUF115 domain-containing protein [Termitinemataceae bacterium]|uniref:6-hydroxymethylpterin diphosphokinase MptE-like protein n=1 Tax=Treponema sp. J25 TaxID=2094121 RepID=UPI00104A0D78|nr:6-hydroxymethylpterin diphosphokinase MptE-like protein [Treponema sp. J25]TCW60835.1 hypothetical protein C5O22_09270 [Treponema sp. J25]HOJ99706.1 DUF115 domain-containing protein [Termitinemataceae bacterium]HOM23877.1 DUF115 domain-containing protein [Termitinemataceae bacterium]HPQ00928.1 DUF115 domain-containing protein [Termitinemataceae bacterium]
MTEELRPTRGGALSLVVNGQCLHSLYDPVKEAFRFLHSLHLPAHTGNEILIVLEPGLGYLIQALIEEKANPSIIIIHVSPFCKEHDPYSSVYPAWSPRQEEGLFSFLEHHIPEGSTLRLIEWPPAEKAYGSSYRTIKQTILNFIHQEEANTRTVQNFGKRWLRNFLINLRQLTVPLWFEQGDQPLIICGAGPSLEDTVPLIQKALTEGNCGLLSVSSATAALTAHRLYPSLVLTTDGGFWARYHGFEVRRSTACPLCIYLGAQVPTPLSERPWLLCTDGSLWQGQFLRVLNLPFLHLPQRGTVSATALDVALELTRGSLYITGFDMGFRDMQSHARPYSLDRLLEINQNRCQPYYSSQWERTKMLQQGEAFQVYASWFREHLVQYPARLNYFGSQSPSHLTHLPSVTQVEGTATSPTRWYRVPWKPPSSSKEILAIFDMIIHDGSTGTYVQRELQKLLGLPQDERPHILIKELLQLIGKYYE